MIRNIFLFLSLILAPLAAEAEGNTGELGSLSTLKAKVEKFTLSNGLRVVLYKREHAPVFNGQIWVRVGGVDEVPGTTGLAHFLEHMAFKGSKTIGTNNFSKEEPLLEKLEDLMQQKLAVLGLVDLDKEKIAKLDEAISDTRYKLKKIWVPNEFSQIYKLRGAVGLNAATGKDYTVYTVSLPTNAFDSWLWMESDRLLNPVFRQFYNCLLYTSPSPRDATLSRMPSSA